ncbi:MAG: cell surface protein SprA, partial [Marinilabiliaceae bacterium]
LSQAKTKAEEDSIKKISQTTETIKSLNFTNVRVKPAKGKKVTLVSPSNLSASYSISTTERTAPETQYDLTKQINGSLGYNYSAGVKTVQPLKKTGLNSKYFGLIKDVTFYTAPTQLSYRWDVDRHYQEVQKRNITNPDYKVPISVTKDFYWNRYFDLRYNITRNLKFGFNSVVNTRIDEPDGPVNKDLYPDEYKHWRDSVWSNIKKFGKVQNYQHNVDLNWTIPVNKLPYLNFLTANTSYKGVYTWQRGSETEDFDWGNVISNKNTEQANVMSNFNTLYNKSKYLRDMYDHYNLSNNTRQQKRKSGKTVSFTQRNTKLTPGEPVAINHNLKTEDVSARAFDAKGHSLKGTLKAIDQNTAVFTPTMASDNARVVITGTISENEEEGRNAFKDMSMMLLTSIKSVSVSYSENNGTTLPGYMPGSHFLGTEGVSGMRAPGFKFITGMQERTFAMRAAERGWLTTDTTFNEPYEMTHSDNLQIRASVEMFRALKVELTAQRMRSRGLSEYYIYGENGFAGVYNTVEGGSTSITMNAIKTAFKKPSKSGNLDYAVYDKYLSARKEISMRLAQSRQRLSNGQVSDDVRDDGGQDGFGMTSQEVMIPAFVAAYTGRSSGNVFLDLVPKLSAISPNWRITFSGLNNIKALREKVRNIELTHNYTSKYTVGQYTTNLDWHRMGDGLNYVRDIDDNYVPQYDATSVSIAEQFSPFIGISATFVNNLTANVAINKGRTLTLSVTNNQITENYSNEWTVNLGYRFDNVKFLAGKRTDSGFNNTLNLTFGLSQRDSYTILRRIEEATNELASGTRTTGIKLSADYAMT